MSAAAAPPPTGPFPSKHLTSEGVRVVAITVVFSVLATFAVVARFWARYLNAFKPVIEDWLVVLGLIFTWGYGAGNIVFAYSGLGIQAAVLVASGRMNDLQNQLKLLIANQVTYAIALGLVKTSILLSLKRIFHVFRTFRIIANCAIGFCICWALQTILIAFLICRPLSYNWDQVNQKGSCGNLTVAYVSIGIVDVISDIIIFILPIPLINRLNMRKSSKWATMSIFSLGLLTIASGAARTGMIVHTRFDPSDPEGPTQNLIWAAIEPCVAIMVASLLVIKPLLVYVRSSISSILSSLPSSWSTRKSSKDPYSSTDRSKSSRSRRMGAMDNESEHQLQGMPSGKIWTTTEVHIDEDDSSRAPSREHRTDIARAV